MGTLRKGSQLSIAVISEEKEIVPPSTPTEPTSPLQSPSFISDTGKSARKHGCYKTWLVRKPGKLQRNYAINKLGGWTVSLTLHILVLINEN
jgi:hypothetical protein